VHGPLLLALGLEALGVNRPNPPGSRRPPGGSRFQGIQRGQSGQKTVSGLSAAKAITSRRSMFDDSLRLQPPSRRPVSRVITGCPSARDRSQSLSPGTCPGEDSAERGDGGGQWPGSLWVKGEEKAVDHCDPRLRRRRAGQPPGCGAPRAWVTPIRGVAAAINRPSVADHQGTRPRRPGWRSGAARTLHVSRRRESGHFVEGIKRENGRKTLQGEQ